MPLEVHETMPCKAWKMLRNAMPPLARGKAEEVELRDGWSSEAETFRSMSQQEIETK